MKQLTVRQMNQRMANGEAFYLTYQTVIRVRKARSRGGVVELETEIMGWQVRDEVREFGAIETIKIVPATVVKGAQFTKAVG